MKISMLSRDFSKIREELIAKIPMLTDRWTDFSEGDIGITLLELMSGVAELLNFYLDRNINECFLSTAKQRKNVVALAKVLGYEVKSATASTGKVNLYFQPSLDTVWVIPKGTIFKTVGEKSIKFFSTEDVIISGGEGEVPVIQGKRVYETFQSTGTARMTFKIAESEAPRINQIAYNYTEVYVDNELWNRVDTFMFSKDTDKHYVVEEDYQGTITIVFGNGIYGKIPSAGAEIKVYYCQTDGINVGANTIKIIETSPPESYTGTFIIKNPDACYGGKLHESIEEIKYEAPLIFASAGRIVTKQDFEGWILKNPAVAKCKVWGEAEENPPNYDMFNIVKYCIVPYPYPNVEVGLEQTSKTLIEEIEKDLAERKVLGVRLEHVQFHWVDIDIEIDAEIDPKYSVDTIKISIKEAVENLLDPDNLIMGQDILPSDFYKELTGIAGVRYINIKSLKRSNPVVDIGGVDITANVQRKELYKWELARVGTIVINISYFKDRFGV